MDDGELPQAPALEAQSSHEQGIDDIPPTKRRKTASGKAPTQGAEDEVPVSTRQRVRPRQPARKDKITEPVTTVPEPNPSISSRKDPTSPSHDVPGVHESIAVEDKQVATKKGDVAAYDADVDADANRSSLPQDLASGRGASIDIGKEVVEKTGKILCQSKAKDLAPTPPDKDAVNEVVIDSRDKRTLENGKNEDGKGEDNHNIAVVAVSGDATQQSTTDAKKGDIHDRSTAR